MSNKTNGHDGMKCLLTARICVNGKINDFSIYVEDRICLQRCFSRRQTRLVDAFAKLPFHLMEIEGGEEEKEKKTNRFSY